MNGLRRINDANVKQAYHLEGFLAWGTIKAGLVAGE
jgi:hypothetical protein